MGGSCRVTDPTPHEVYLDLLKQLGTEPYKHVEIQGDDPVLPSPHRLGASAAAALAALGTEIAGLWRSRTGIEEPVQVDVETGIAQLMAIFLTTLNGLPIRRLLEDPKLLTLSDFYKAKGGRFVFLLHTYPHLRDINLKVLNSPFERESLEKAVAQWDAFELEESIGSLGGTCIAVRTREEWVRSPQGAALLDTPVVDIERVGESAPEPFTNQLDVSAGKPLQGIRVLDNTHVIAGPMAGRILGEYGAEVLWMSTPDHPDPRTMNTETSIGKRSAHCELNTEQGKKQFWAALCDADVYISSYLSLEKKGFGVQELIKARPGLIFSDFHAWGKGGLWQQRHGFDQLACSATGFADEEGRIRYGDGRPSLPPTYLLNDYLAALVGTAGIVKALQLRAVNGGSYRVHVNLSRIAMWVQSLGSYDSKDVAHLPRFATDTSDGKPGNDLFTDKVKLVDVDGPSGRTSYLPTQIRFGSQTIKPGFHRGSEPTGASGMEFLTHRGL
ncbi:hypothetical protein PV08_10107 [Exophiala spinifera]|uniref:Uncharacterized protein n=1 Tax=Exophiala spinifera TaxID=91928 RepID=A0A0D2AVP2_9EURO|nr:uncharacterized protein PV08_10107 [Exophiala spinifera]KIW10808.1 hypothetical protein PV08_10107 [Exophiala spinifera]